MLISPTKRMLFVSRRAGLFILALAGLSGATGTNCRRISSSASITLAGRCLPLPSTSHVPATRSSLNITTSCASAEKAIHVSSNHVRMSPATFPPRSLKWGRFDSSAMGAISRFSPLPSKNRPTLTSLISQSACGIEAGRYLHIHFLGIVKTSPCCVSSSKRVSVATWPTCCLVICIVTCTSLHRSRVTDRWLRIPVSAMASVQVKSPFLDIEM